MSEIDKAPDPANLETELLDQVFTEDRQSEEQDVEKKEDGETSETEQLPDEEAESTDDKKEDDDGTAMSEEKSEDSQQKTVKLGNREFQSTDEAIKEAERLVGHNANLAHELSDHRSKLETAESKLQEALEANKQWADWAEAQKSGEETERPDTPKIEDVVRKALEERDRVEQTKVLERQMKEEVDKLQALSNFDKALPILKELATKVNPSTGSHFTPFEAYEYACWKLSLQNELNKKEEKPVSPASGALKAATRPTGSAKAPPKQDVQKPDEVDEMLSQYF